MAAPAEVLQKTLGADAVLEESRTDIDEQHRQEFAVIPLEERVAAAVADPVRAYLNRIAETPLLTAEDEVDLAVKIESGLLADQILAFQNDPEAAAAKQQEREQFLKNKVAEGKKVEGTIERVHALQILAKQYSGIENKKLLQALSKQGEAAKDHFLRANLRLAVSIARRYHERPGMTSLDFIQEANLGLYRAIEKFDYTKGYKFSTYATWWIKQAINRSITEQGYPVGFPANYTIVLYRMSETIEQIEAETGTWADPEAVAEIMEMPVEKVLDLMRWYNLSSLDMNVSDKGLTLGALVSDEELLLPETMVIARQEVSIAQAILSRLDTIDAQIIRLHLGLVDDIQHSYQEIADRLGIGIQEVRNRGKRSLLKLRTMGAAARALS